MKRIVSLLVGLLFSVQTVAATFAPHQILTATDLNNALANAAITSGTISGATISASPISGSTGSFTTLASPSVSLTGGLIDGVSLGTVTPSPGAFTTLSASGTVSGTGFSTYLASPPAIGGTAPAAGAFTTLSASSTVSGTGFSTYLASPPAIGGTAPAAGAFTTLSASGTVSGTGFSTYLASPPAIGGTTPAAGSFTTVTSTVATGTPPFTVASTTPVTNLSIGGNAATATAATTATTATTATNIAGGAGGSVPYQSAAGTTAMLANGTAGQVLQSNGGTAAPSWGSLTLSGKNRIINGAMVIDQRNAGAAQTITAGAALAYTVDRWWAASTGANVTGQRVAGSGASQYRYQFTGAASVTGIQFGQRIEQLNSYDLNNATATLSVDLADSLLTTVTWTAYYANTADTFGTLASPTKTQIATGTFTVNSTVTNYSTQISIPAAATTGIEIVFSVGAQTSGTWTIGNVQLESGSVKTTFEKRLYTSELELCQRYHINVTNHSIGVALNGTDTYQGGYFHLPVTMRAAPTLDAGATYAVSSGAAGTPGLLNTTGGHTTQDVALFTNTGTGWTSPARVEVTCGLSAEL